MTRCFQYLLLSVLFFSCGKNKSTPDGILPPEKMEVVMWDIMRADQFLNDYVLSRDPAKDKEKESVTLYRRIFSIHKISKEEFQKSLAYYKDHPEHLKPVLDSIQNKKQMGPNGVLPVIAPETKPADTNGAAQPQSPSMPPGTPNIDSIRAKHRLGPVKQLTPIKPD